LLLLLLVYFTIDYQCNVLTCFLVFLSSFSSLSHCLSLSLSLSLSLTRAAFTANNDLLIGNVTFGAGRLQSLALRRPGAMVFAGNGGLLADSDRLSFSRNTLSTPALRVERIVSDVDMRGNAIEHVVLRHARLAHCDIQADSLTMPHLKQSQGGLAFFDKDGRLSASTGLAIDSDSGELALSRLSRDVDVDRHVVIRGGTLTDFALDRISSLRTHNLVLIPTAAAASSSSSSSRATGVLVADEDGTVSVAPRHLLSFAADEAGLSLQSLSLRVLKGETDARTSVLRGVTLRGGEIAHCARINTDTLSINALRPNTASFAKGTAKAAAATGHRRRLVFANDQGELHALFERSSRKINTKNVHDDDDNSKDEEEEEEEEEEPIHVPRLSVDELFFSTDEIDLRGKVLKNVRLDPLTAALEKSSHIAGQSLSLDVLRASVATAEHRTAASETAAAATTTTTTTNSRSTGERTGEVAVVGANRDGAVQRVSALRLYTENNNNINNAEPTTVLDTQSVFLRTSDLSVSDSLSLPFLFTTNTHTDANNNNNYNGNLTREAQRQPQQPQSQQQLLLSVDGQSARVSVVSSVTVAGVSVSQRLSVEAAASVHFADWADRQPTLLAVDSAGRLTRVALGATTTDNNNNNNKQERDGVQVDAQLRAVSAQSLHVERQVVSGAVDTQSLTLRPAKALSDEEHDKAGNVLVVNKVGYCFCFGLL
jgi:hypothetical protein